MFNLEKLGPRSFFRVKIGLLQSSKKRVLKQVVGGAKRKSKILMIPNKYKNTFNDLMDSSNAESLEVFRSEGASIGARPDLEGDHLDINERG